MEISEVAGPVEIDDASQRSNNEERLKDCRWEFGRDE